MHEQPQAGMPSVAVVCRTETRDPDEGRAFSVYFATVYFLRRPAWAVADVQQRRVYRRCCNSGTLVHAMSATTANAGASGHFGSDRVATDAISEPPAVEERICQSSFIGATR